MAKDYIGKFDAREATGLNLDTKSTHNWAVSAGLRSARASRLFRVVR